MILKKGYYILDAETMEIVSGEDAIDDPEDAHEEWKSIAQQTPGNNKFAILWIPNDNLAWGE